MFDFNNRHALESFYRPNWAYKFYKSYKSYRAYGTYRSYGATEPFGSVITKERPSRIGKALIFSIAALGAALKG